MSHTNNQEVNYIRITNLVKIQIATRILRDILPNFDGVITDHELREIIVKLSEFQKRLSNKIS